MTVAMVLHQVNLADIAFHLAVEEALEILSVVVVLEDLDVSLNLTGGVAFQIRKDMEILVDSTVVFFALLIQHVI
jgi:hypothetical protein